MRYVFFVNPIAGKGNLQEKIICEIKRYFSNTDKDFHVYITRFRGDALELSRREAETGKKIRMFACGGEGTCFEVINGSYGFDNVSVGVIPCGSANDFLKFFHTSDAFSDIESQIDGEEVMMDLIKAGDKYCLNGCSVGMDAMVAKDMSLFKRLPFVTGSMAYNLAIIKTFLRKLGVKIKVSIDDGNFTDARCLFASVANAPYYGGGYMPAPEAIPNDGILDFTMVDVISRFKVPKFLSLYKKGKHKSLDYCSIKTCTSMEFKAERKIPVNLDGEIIETESLRFEIVRNALSFVMPKKVYEELYVEM